MCLCVAIIAGWVLVNHTKPLNMPGEVLIEQKGEILATSTSKESENVILEPQKSTLREELIPICRCESGLRQYNDDGSVLKGYLNKHDIGICQINEIHWGEKAKELEFDIYTENGNIDMANWIFETEGSWPWNWSKSCWEK